MHISELKLILAEKEEMEPIYKKLRDGSLEASKVFFGVHELTDRGALILHNKGYKVDYNRYTEQWAVWGWDA